MRELDAQLVRRRRAAPVGPYDPARGAQRRSRSPPTCSARETIARLLELRLNHPQGSEDLERAPRAPASRAEAAYSLAKLRLLDPARIALVQELADGFTVPALSGLQREVLARALRLVGQPYVFAGMSEKTQTLWSATARGNTITVPGGFDCSGFVWRVYKLQPFANTRRWRRC